MVFTMAVLTPKSGTEIDFYREGVIWGFVLIEADVHSCKATLLKSYLGMGVLL